MDVHPKYPSWIPAPFRTGYFLSRRVNRVFSVLDDSEIEMLNSVEGHTTRRQCAVLFYFAYTQPGPGRIVEIGSFKGQSTGWLAYALKLLGQNNKVVAIDPHKNTEDIELVPQYKEESSYEAFLDNMKRLGVMSWIKPVKATSVEAVKTWEQPIKLLFVDGSHKYEDVLQDLHLWEPWVSIGGTIILHDTKPGHKFPGVRRAMNEYLVNTGRFRESLQLLNMTVFKKSLPGKRGCEE